jgi:hypothetical protein
MAKAQFLNIFRGLTREVDEVTVNASATGPHNIHLRQLYSKLELLLLDMEESMIEANSKDLDVVDDQFFVVMQVLLSVYYFALSNGTVSTRLLKLICFCYNTEMCIHIYGHVCVYVHIFI